MPRTVVSTESQARAELGGDRSKPDWREGRPALPFHELSDREFEVFCFLLLKREHPGDDVLLYGGTGDGGRDIVHRIRTPAGVTTRLIQCKRYESNVGIPVVRKDLAKVWVNVFNGTIPERPDEVVFYAVPDLTSHAKDLVDSQNRWRQEAPGAIEEHLGSPASEELARHAREWWPNPAAETALSLTERARKFTEMVEEFFGVRKVIDGGVGDMAGAVRAIVLPPLESLVEGLARVERAVAPPLPAAPAAVGDLKAAFARSSTELLGQVLGLEVQGGEEVPGHRRRVPDPPRPVQGALPHELGGQPGPHGVRLQGVAEAPEPGRLGPAPVLVGQEVRQRAPAPPPVPGRPPLPVPLGPGNPAP
ncbi:MAG: hypothetical protein C0501_30920, partial [Isosphaera sp.]|nr:hypothetical protein [Isosphaera sp.]